MSTVKEAYCGVFNSGTFSGSDGHSYDQWSFYDGTPLSTCRVKMCNGTGNLYLDFVKVDSKIQTIAINSQYVAKDCYNEKSRERG